MEIDTPVPVVVVGVGVGHSCHSFVGGRVRYVVGWLFSKSR